MDLLDKQAGAIQDSRKQQLVGVIKGFHKDIVDDFVNNTLPESVFVELFLEFFKSGGHMNTVAPLTQKWIELAGGPYNEVNIIDANGKVVYSTPGLYCKPETALGNVDFHKIVSEFNLRSNRLTVDGLNYLNVQLQTKVAPNIKTDVDPYVLRWQNIFNRYNKQKQTTAIQKMNKIDNTAGFLEYD